MAQLHRDLSVLSVEYETLFRQTGQEVLHQLSVYDGNVERQMQRIENISDLEKFTLQGLHEFWDTVKQESVIRRKWIKDLDDTLAKYESDRTIAALLRKYTGKLEKICYIMPSDIHRLINREAMMINQAILANRRAVAKLYLNLMENDLQKEVFHRLRWEDKLQDWKSFKVLGVVSRDFIGSPPIQCPKDVQAILDTMRAAQQSFRERRIKILHAMIPPRCSKTLITEWYNSLSSVNEQIDCMHIDSMRKLHSYYENTWQECLAEVEQVKKEITTYGVSPEEIQDTVNAEFLPLIGKCQSQTEEHLAAMDRAFESLAKRAAVLSKSLFKFTRGASHLWEVHSAGLQRREQQLQDQLDEKEAHLDVMLDRLRQETTIGCFSRNIIVFLYRKMESYPAMVLEELHSYSSAVSRFFNVKEIYTGSQFLDSQSSETFCTSKGNVYNSQSFVSQWDTEQDSIPSEMELVVFPRSLLADLQKDLRLLFFNHLEERYQTALTNTMNIVAAKKEALKSEQDLRLHLHQPRAKRIEVDIHNVRAAELVLHRDRVDRHCKGILQALGNCRTDFHELQIRQHKLTEDFRSQIYSMEDVFTYATKSDVLVGLCGTLQSNLESHMNIIQASQRNFRQTLESKLDGLRETNIQLIKSFKLFSDGGNFTPKEIEAHHKRIEKMVKRIDTNDEAIMLDMEGTESKCLELAKDVINRFEEKFHFLTVDLKFLEKIQGMLTNTQVQIKTEATKSNMQNKKINSLLTELKSMVDTCARSSPEKVLNSIQILIFTLFKIFPMLIASNTNVIVCGDQEFYKKKERRPITRPQYLQETFEQCAEEINKRLLIYQSQTQDYHNNCLQEFRQQLKDIEEGLSKVPGVLISNLGEQHLWSLSQDTNNIRQQLGITLHESEGRKKKHSGKLSVRLSHPACEKELEALNRAEEERQRELTNAITNTLQELQACVRKHGEEFVRALTSLTENLLFQMDNLLTVDEVQVGRKSPSILSENVTTLIRRKQAGIPLEEKQSAHQIQRGSRSSADGPVEQPCKETASITTAKTTLGHLRAVEARDSMYQVGGQGINLRHLSTHTEASYNT
uniref:Coiled-coil domain containing 180 n=1 Tax=Hucho hucho TaxID=62062 RepID=A0A4W5QDV3_9TELE